MFQQGYKYSCPAAFLAMHVTYCCPVIKHRQGFVPLSYPGVIALSEAPSAFSKTVVLQHDSAIPVQHCKAFNDPLFHPVSTDMNSRVLLKPTLFGGPAQSAHTV